MNFLLTNYEYPPVGGGGGTAAAHLARELVHLGHKAVVLTAAWGPYRGLRTESGVLVYRLPAGRKRPDRSNLLEMVRFLLAGAMSLRSLLREQDIQAHLAFFSFPGGPLGLWGWYLEKVPYVVSLRGGDVPGTEPQLAFLHQVLRPLRHRIFALSRAVVANSFGLKEMSEAVDPFPVKVIPNGVDCDFFCPAKGNKDSRGVARLLFVGRFQPQKNLFFLLQQVSCLRSLSPRPFELHLVGDGPQGEALRREAARLGLGDVVKWHGWLTDKREMRRLYQSAHVLLNPSLYEGLPNVVLEAMACGLPVIASKVVGNTELVAHQKTGFLFSLQQPEEFREFLKTLLENPGLAEFMGKMGRERVCQLFSWKKAAMEYSRLFD